MNIVVLAGGLSPERDVSLSSGSLIANALSRDGNAVLLLDIYRGLDTPLPDDISSLFVTGADYSYKVESAEPDLDAVRASCGGREALIGEGVLDVCRAADVVFIALHGAMGENGQLQATLDNFGIRHYTGTGFIGALLAMDKDLSKRLLTAAGIPNADWIYYDTDSDTPDIIMQRIGLPCVVKPTSCGSSVGVTPVHDRKQLNAALAAAAKYESRLVIEKFIRGRELTVGILDGRALPPVEIIPKTGFYDYKNKYQSGMTVEICPAPLTSEQLTRISQLALAAFSALRMEMYGRADFILGSDGEFYCLEVNALPGMTPTSLLPQEAAAIGIGYDELCAKLALMAYKKGQA